MSGGAPLGVDFPEDVEEIGDLCASTRKKKQKMGQIEPEKKPYTKTVGGSTRKSGPKKLKGVGREGLSVRGNWSALASRHSELARERRETSIKKERTEKRNEQET